MRRALALFTILFATACGSSDNTDPSGGDGPQPFLQKPFAGEYLVTNPMDHDTPKEFIDNNGHAITSWGETAAFFDGHAGYDFAMPVGTPLLAAAAGTVVSSEPSTFSCPALGHDVTQLGVQIKHTLPDGSVYWTYYAHMSRVDVSTGQTLSAGAQIGLSGNTGCSTAPHLHFQLDRITGTNNGQLAEVDPYGWTGDVTDPWELNAAGAKSVYLWKAGQAPVMFVGIDSVSSPFNGPFSGTGGKPVVISRISWMGPHDETNPNNEYVEIAIDPAITAAASYDLTGMYIRNNIGDRFDFPAGTTLLKSTPIRVYTGAGTNTSSVFYWGKTAGVFSNTGDCAELIYPNGGYYLEGWRVGCH